MIKIKILTVLIIFSGIVFSEASGSIEYVKGRITEIHSEAPSGEDGIQPVTVKILRGKYRNTSQRIDNIIWAEDGYNTLLKLGLPVVIKVIEREGMPSAMHIVGHYRSPFLYLAGILFIVFFLLLAGFRKIGVLFSILLNIFLIIGVLMPLLKSGFSPVAATLIVIPIGAAITVAIVLGGGKKFITAILGITTGLITAVIITFIFMNYMKIEGMFFWDARMLLIAYRHIEGWYLSDLKGLLASGVMVACLGAVIDIAITISSACYNIARNSKNITSKKLLLSGMQVGKDIIATMLNSLMLIFVGMALPLIAIFEVMNIPYLQVINFEIFAVLIITALAASISMVITVPASAYAASKLLVK